MLAQPCCHPHPCGVGDRAAPGPTELGLWLGNTSAKHRDPIPPPPAATLLPNRPQTTSPHPHPPSTPSSKGSPGRVPREEPTPSAHPGPRGASWPGAALPHGRRCEQEGSCGTLVSTYLPAHPGAARCAACPGAAERCCRVRERLPYWPAMGKQCFFKCTD